MSEHTRNMRRHTLYFGTKIYWRSN